MSATKRWLEDLSVQMGYDGAITAEFLDELDNDPNCLFPPPEVEQEPEPMTRQECPYLAESSEAETWLETVFAY